MTNNDLANTMRAILARQGRSGEEVAQAAGLGRSAVNDILSGRSKRPRYDTLLRIAKVLNVPVEQLTNEDRLLRNTFPSDSQWTVTYNESNPDSPVTVPAPPAGARDLPVLGEARGGENGFFLTNGEVLAYAERPPALRNVRHAYALVMRGTSMEPRYFEGELLCIHPLRPVNRDNFVHIELHDGRSYVKQFLRRDNEWVWVRQLNPEATVQFRAPDIKHIRRIIATAEDW